VSRAQASFGSGLRFTFNSIIVKPNDKACDTAQDVDTSPSHPAFVYSLMSSITDGGIGSICDADYSANLNIFKDKIVNSLNQVTLQCEPVEGTLKVKVNGQWISNFKTDKKLLKFAKSLVEGTQIELTYECKN
jgi:hypothetical protein